MLKVSSQIKTKSEEEYERAVNLNEFKGIYANDNCEQNFYEGGAHFRYNELCYRLEKVVSTLDPERRGKTIYEDKKIEGKFLFENLYKRKFIFGKDQ